MCVYLSPQGPPALQRYFFEGYEGGSRWCAYGNVRSSFFLRVLVSVLPAFEIFGAFFDDAWDQNDILGVKFCEISLFCRKIWGLTKKWCTP